MDDPSLPEELKEDWESGGGNLATTVAWWFVGALAAALLEALEG